VALAFLIPALVIEFDVGKLRLICQTDGKCDRFYRSLKQTLEMEVKTVSTYS
jgi:hypothetical protein